MVIHVPIPPNGSGWWTVAAALVTGAIGLLGGNHRGTRVGRIEGETKWMDSVREGAALVIEGLSAQHEECRRELADVRHQIAEIMKDHPPPYHFNRPTDDAT